MKRFKILGTGSALPEKVLTNEDLEKMVDTSDEWITTRTGIKERHIADKNTAASDLVVLAAKKAIEMAKIDKSEIDCIIVATISPDTLFPSTSCWVQKKLGLKEIPAFDISAACSGFLYGIQVISDLITAGTCNTILLAGVEILTKITDWKDRSTCVLFGDGAGVIIAKKTEEDRGLLSSVWGADGNLGELLIQPAGGSRIPASEESVKKGLHYVKMKGNEVFKHAVRRMGDAAESALKKANLTNEDISLFIPHQANIRIIEATCKRTGISMDKTHNTIDKYANMSSATIPIALDDAARKGKIKRGDNILFASFGAGFTWAASIIKW